MSELLQPVIGIIPDQVQPDPESVSYYVLENDRKIYLDYEIGPDVLSLHRMILRWNMEDAGKSVTDRKPIHIYIMSPGGHLEYMWMLIDAIRASVTPVYTINTGVAASAAALIFISGHKRFMMKNATTLFHEGSASMQGDAVKIMDASDNYRKALDRMKKYIIDNTRITPKQLGKKLHNDWELDAEQCLEAGVCDVLVSILDEVI